MDCIHDRGLVKLSAVQAWNQTNWPENWNEKQRKREDLLEREKCEKMFHLVLQDYQYYKLFFMA